MSKRINFKGKKAIVFSGGGVLGVGTAGAMEKLNELGYWDQFNGFAGASVGSIFAVGMAMRAKPQYITKLVWDTDFRKFFDDTRMDAGVCDIRRFLKRFGWFKGDELLKFYETICQDLSGNPKITFLEVNEKFGRDIFITTYCANDQTTKEFSYKTVPHMPVALGMRCSSSYPYVLAAERITANDMNKYTEGVTVTTHKHDLLFADGGILNNFPVDLLLKNGYSLEEILGIHLHAEPQPPSTDVRLPPPKNIVKYTINMAKTIINQAGKTHISDKVWKETISIDTFDIKSMDFNITQAQKTKLYKSGVDAVTAVDDILT